MDRKELMRALRAKIQKMQFKSIHIPSHDSRTPFFLAVALRGVGIASALYHSVGLGVIGPYE